MVVNLTATDIDLHPDQVGGKAYNLAVLAKLGMPVPPAIAIPASFHGNITPQDLFYHINNHPMVKEGYKYAVRSSGVGEDGQSNSFAGIFESFLDVSSDELHLAVYKVWESIRNNRSLMYEKEKSASVTSMGVIIQRMIEADYAGVAFSVSPLEKDNRIALMEVVKGNGDSLVSGTKTPATLRINKLTSMVRVQQTGEDAIPNSMLIEISEILLPCIKKIEEGYGVPVDIEWAIANKSPYILQARPITA